MDLQVIRHGTFFIIDPETPVNKDGRGYRAKFYEALGGDLFLVEGRELYRDFKEIGEETVLNIYFLHMNEFYTFKGKARGVKTEFGTRLTKIERISAISAGSRRVYPRHEINVPVRIFSTRTTAADEALFSGYAFDISLGGINVLANEKYRFEEEGIVKIAFVLSGYYNFLMDSIFVRQSDSPNLVQYKYDYGFKFLLDESGDGKNAAAQRDKLSMAMLSHKLKNRR